MSEKPKTIPVNTNAKKIANLENYDKVYDDFTWKKAESEYVDYFDNGKLNIAYNCIDRHAKSDKKDKTALIYQAADGSKETYSFAQMKTETDKFANVLKSQSVAKGDRVFIFPNQGRPS